ncbi:MAG: tRNA threonylcarbamoyladenosine dehydratase [Oscillospiraceae bacterium]|nr:tRNA threonylcarbamoyladenosine dehydratase [Oscillospiraceae bacterium]
MKAERASRLALLVGDQGVERLESARVAVFGLGGVGSYAAEFLCRSGVGRLDIIDGDVVAESNINRQLPALGSTVGMEKTKVMAARLGDINSQADIRPLTVFFDENTASQFDFTAYDYVVDAIDSVPSKLLLIKICTGLGVPVISSMGAGNRLDPTAFRVVDIYKTDTCPLARTMRRELKKMGIKKLKTVCSGEIPLPVTAAPEEQGGRSPLGSIAHVTAAAGGLLAWAVIEHLLGGER